MCVEEWKIGVKNGGSSLFLNQFKDALINNCYALAYSWALIGFFFGQLCTEDAKAMLRI